MGTKAEREEVDTCCASCGMAEVDDVKLMDCDGGCDIVKYCSDDCQENHRTQHEKECSKRLSELRDRDLFTMPDSRCYDDCPICCLPQPIDPSKSIRFMDCCSKVICNGCNVANQKREFEVGLEQRCAFCREPLPKSDEEADKRMMKRIKNNDPAAMCHMGKQHYREGSYETALEYYTKAAEMGDAIAHYALSCLYHKGQGVERDVKREIYHSEEAAIGGHHKARHNLGCLEANNDNFERARKHFIIAANLGYHDSLKCLRQLHADGHASKEDYANALCAYQTVVAAAKSSQRDEAERYQELYHNFVATGSRR